MADQPARRSFVFIPLTIASCAMLAGLIVPGVEEAQAATADSDLDQANKVFTQVYALVEDNFADPNRISLSDAPATRWISVLTLLTVASAISDGSLGGTMLGVGLRR